MSERIAIVTGAASGIGKATAGLLAQTGAHVVCMDLDDGGLRSAVKEIEEAGGRAVAHQGDVSSDVDCAAAVATAGEFGGLDVLVNVAGIMAEDDTVESLPPQTWERVLAVNVGSIFLLGRHAIPAMRLRGGGVIVNTASVHAFATMPGTAAYAASKGAVVALTRQMALDCTPHGIRVVAVAPGSVDTPLSQLAVDRAGVSSLEELGFSRSVRDIGRVAQPNEIAVVIEWLASDAASFINGVTLPVDGALLAKLV